MGRGFGHGAQGDELHRAKKDASGDVGHDAGHHHGAAGVCCSPLKKARRMFAGRWRFCLMASRWRNLRSPRTNNDLLHQFVFKGIGTKGIGSRGGESRSGELEADELRSETSRIIQRPGHANTVEIRFDGTGGLAYQIVGSYFVPWQEKPENEALSINVAYDRTHLAQDDVATARATIQNNLPKSANMVMVDLGIPPGFDLLSEDLQEYVEKSGSQKTGCLEKFSQTATQAILYFNSIAPGATLTLHFRLRAKYPIRARTFQSRVYEYYDPEVSALARPVQLEVRAR